MSVHITFPFGVPPIRLDPGCQGIVNSGCGRRFCSRLQPGTCVTGLVPGVLPGSTTPACGGQGPHGRDDRISDACDGLGGCLTTLDSSVCADDGIACTLEACLPAAPNNFCQIQGLPSPPCEHPSPHAASSSGEK